MAKEVNGNFDILGSLNLSTVPNSTGTIVTYNPSTRAIGTRTNTQILADLGLTSVISNSHAPVTLGTANGLSLSGQQLSLGLASTNSTGALSSAHWNIFNSKFDLPSGGTVNHYLNGLGQWVLFPTLQNLIAGNHIDITGNVISVDVNSSNYEVLDVKRNSPSAGSAVNFVNDSGKLGDIGFGVINNDFHVRGASGDTLFRINQANNVPSFPNLPGVQTGTTGNLAYINTSGEIWRHQITIGDLITTSNIGNYIPPAQTLITNTYSVNNNTGGYVGITGGNDISISSVGRNNLINRDDLTNFGAGLFPIFNTTGSTNYPSVTGAGIVSVRNSANNAGGNFMLWTTATNSTDLYYDTSTTTGWAGMRIIASTDYVDNAITTAGGNYMTTNTSQGGLTGNKVSTGYWQFAFRGNTWYTDEASAERIYFGTGTNTNGIIFKNSNVNHWFQFRDTANTVVAYINNLGQLTASQLRITGGTSSQFLKADGSVDTNAYALASSIPSINDYWTTNTTQTGLSGNKTTSGALIFNGTQATPLFIQRTGSTSNSSIAFGFNSTNNVFIGAGDASNFTVSGTANLIGSPWLYANENGVGTRMLAGQYISGRDQGGFTVDKTSTASNWSSILRHNFSGVGRTAIIGGINGTSAMQYWGMAMWDNAETVNGFPAVFFGFVGNNGALRATSLAGTGTRVVVANATGDLSTTALTNGTVTSVSSTVAGTALNVSVTNPTTTPAIGFTWSGTSSQVVLGNGALGTIPAQLVYTGSNGINVTGTVISPVYGTAANTIAQGNDSRILNGQTAFGWGNHAGLYVPLGRTLTINGQTFDLSANRSWTIPDTDTVTRLRGTTAGTYTSGDLTLLAGSNIAIAQSGTNFTISATNTTYSGSASIIAVGNTFQRAALVGGEVTAAQNSNSLALTTTGITPGTYNQLTVDSKGRATAGANQPYQTATQVGTAINNAIAPLIDEVTRHFATGSMNIPINTKKTIVTVDTGVINIDLDIDDAPYNGYELAINGCGEWSANLNGRFIDKCNNVSPISVSTTSVLFWWNKDRWEQAI